MKKTLILLAFVLCSICGFAQKNNGVSSNVTKYGQALYYINNYYLDTVNFTKIVNEALTASVKELDPHSSFISAEDVAAMNEPLEGEFDGIGVQFAIINDTLTVQDPVAGGPSEKVGVLSGDKIVAVDGEAISGKSLNNQKVFKYLRGPKGTKVDLTIVRKGVKGQLEFTVVRDKIPLYSVDAAFQPVPGYLYIKFSRFAISSHDEIVKAIKEAGEVKGLVLDMRSNAGGYLGTAIEIANEFLDEGQMIVYTEGRAFPRMEESARGNGIYTKGPLVLLIDENSASASEILAGAIQDWDRGIVIGRRSFGKGLVQRAMPLNDGSELRLTVARYHTPSGRVIQSPYEKGKAEDYYMNFLQRYSSGETFSRDSIHFPDSLKYQTLKNLRTVYGGGGIMPDIFIPSDTSYFSDYYSSLLRQGVVIEFMNKQVDMHRAEWKKQYPDFHSFETSFSISPKMMVELVELARQKGIEPNTDQLKLSESNLKQYMMALAAASLYTSDCYYRIINVDDPTFEKAVDVVKNWESYFGQLTAKDE